MTIEAKKTTSARARRGGKGNRLARKQARKSRQWLTREQIAKAKKDRRERRLAHVQRVRGIEARRLLKQSQAPAATPVEAPPQNGVVHTEVSA